METLNSFKRLSGKYTGLMMVFVIAFNLVLHTNAKAQTPYKAVAGSQIKVLGTSNIHDWTMTAESFTCEAQFADQLRDLTDLTFTLPVKNLKAKEDLMNTRAYKALKEEQFNRITFKLSNAEVIPQQKIIKATGSLTIAGVSREIPIQANYVVNADESITCTATKKIKMSEFKINPPSFMMGALKVGDEVTINLNLKLKK